MHTERARPRRRSTCLHDHFGNSVENSTHTESLRCLRSCLRLFHIEFSRIGQAELTEGHLDRVLRFPAPAPCPVTSGVRYIRILQLIAQIWSCPCRLLAAARQHFVQHTAIASLYGSYLHGSVRRWFVSIGYPFLMSFLDRFNSTAQQRRHFAPRPCFSKSPGPAPNCTPHDLRSCKTAAFLPRISTLYAGDRWAASGAASVPLPSSLPSQLPSLFFL